MHRFLYVRIDGDNTSSIVGDVEKIYKKIFEGHPFQYQFLDERFERLYDAERKMSSALVSGAAGVDLYLLYRIVWTVCLYGPSTY